MEIEQINRTIAESCGWNRNGSSGNEENPWVSPRNGIKPRVPNYTSDLNAMHEAESSLSDDKLFVMARWIQHLTRSTLIGVAVMHSSARDRAEAYLRTIDKWES